VQRSVQAGRQGLTEEKYDELLNFADSDKFTEREKIALTYTSAIAWNSDIADDELGFFIGLTLGQQRWIKTLDIDHGAVLGDTAAGLAPVGRQRD